LNNKNQGKHKEKARILEYIIKNIGTICAHVECIDNTDEDEESKRKGSTGAWRANSISVRAMIVEALSILLNGGTIHDILEYMHDNYPQEVKNLKDVQSAVQSQLSARKEFAKVAKTDKNLTVWSLTTQKGMKKVQKPHKQHKRAKRSSDNQEDDDVSDSKDDEDLSEEDQFQPEPNITVTLNGASDTLVIDALKSLGGSGTISDIRERMISNYPNQFSSGYKLNRILTTSSLFQVENLQNGMKLYRLIKTATNGNNHGKLPEMISQMNEAEKEVSELLVDLNQ